MSTIKCFGGKSSGSHLELLKLVGKKKPASTFSDSDHIVRMMGIQVHKAKNTNNPPTVGQRTVLQSSVGCLG